MIINTGNREISIINMSRENMTVNIQSFVQVTIFSD